MEFLFGETFDEVLFSWYTALGALISIMLWVYAMRGLTAAIDGRFSWLSLGVFGVDLIIMETVFLTEYSFFAILYFFWSSPVFLLWMFVIQVHHSRKRQREGNCNVAVNSETCAEHG